MNSRNPKIHSTLGGKEKPRGSKYLLRMLKGVSVQPLKVLAPSERSQKGQGHPFQKRDFKQQIPTNRHHLKTLKQTIPFLGVLVIGGWAPLVEIWLYAIYQRPNQPDQQTKKPTKQTTKQTNQPTNQTNKETHPQARPGHFCLHSGSPMTLVSHHTPGMCRQGRQVSSSLPSIPSNSPGDAVVRRAVTCAREGVCACVCVCAFVFFFSSPVFSQVWKERRNPFWAGSPEFRRRSNSTFHLCDGLAQGNPSKGVTLVDRGSPTRKS